MRTSSVAAAFFIACGLLSAQGDGSFDRSLNVSGPVQLDVVTDAGGIRVRPGFSQTVRVHAILRAQHSFWNSGDVDERMREIERHPPVEQTGNNVRVGYFSDRAIARGISIRYEIETPPDTRLRARADSGGITAQGLHGAADCHTDSGGIDLRDIGSDVHATADSGGIHINGVNGALFARADSGGIEGMNVSGPIDVQVDSGGVRLSQTHPASVRARADSGAVSLELARGSGYDVHLSSSSGAISVPEMTVKSSYDRHRVDGKIRDGGPLIDIKVDSGGISVRQ